MFINAAYIPIFVSKSFDFPILFVPRGPKTGFLAANRAEKRENHALDRYGGRALHGRD